MKRFHLALGALLLVVFVLTGQYMDRVHAHLSGMDVGPRMLYRTRHIFILFVALLHVGLGTYVQPGTGRIRVFGQWVGSSLIALSGGFFVAGFVYEPGWRDLQTPLSHWGAYAVLAGVLLHAVVGRSSPRRAERSADRIAVSSGSQEPAAAPGVHAAAPRR